MYFEIELDQPLPDDKPHDRCGIFGIFGHPQSAQLTYYGLHALQHRGQEGAGVVTSERMITGGKNRFHFHKDFGLVNDVFRDDRLFTETLLGTSAIGHNRYSTTGSSDSKLNLQPITVNYRNGNMAVGHNGNFTNFNNLREKFQDDGTIFLSTSDTELFLHLVAKSKQKDQVQQVIEALNHIEGAFSLVILTDTALIAARDPHGWRPLAVGRLDGAFVVASETCAFDIIKAEHIGDVNPGEVLVFDDEVLKTGIPKSYHLNKIAEKTHHCIFEYIYFSRPDSKIFGVGVDGVRRQLGKALADEHPITADGEDPVIVINVPDSSNTATLGFMIENRKLGNNSHFEMGLIRSHYVGRTFITPHQDTRELRVRTKFNTVKEVLKGKKVVIVDDSVVRGTTSKQLVNLIREAEPKEIHFRISSPPVCYPCYYGMDFPSKEELIANVFNHDIEKIGKELGVDSIGYLSLEKLLDSVPHSNGESYCTACFNGDYPTTVETRTKTEHEC